MKPTKPNKSGKATASDSVQTPINVAQFMVRYFTPKGICLEPCRGNGNIFNELPAPKYFCEIKENNDFFDFRNKVDWILTNPPYSIYDKFLEHCFQVSDNVVLLVPIAKAFKSMAIERLVDDYGGLKEIVLLGGGQKCGFAFGFPTGFLYYKRGYCGDIKRTVKIIKSPNAD